MSPQEKKVLSRFAASAQREYGERLLGIYAFDYLFDDDAEDEEMSVDADVAVVLADGEWRFLEEKKRLVRLTFDILLDTQVYVRAWPLPASAAVGWVERERRPNTTATDCPSVGSLLRSTQPTIEDGTR